MIKGTQKRMIVCKPPAHSPFEVAYFILRHPAPCVPQDENDMLKAAHRIMEDGDLLSVKKKKSSHKAIRRVFCGILWFVLGNGFGVLVSLCFFRFFS